MEMLGLNSAVMQTGNQNASKQTNRRTGIRQAARSRHKYTHQSNVPHERDDDKTVRQSMNACYTSVVAPEADKQMGMRQLAWRLSMQREVTATIKSVKQASSDARKQVDRCSNEGISNSR